MNSKNLKEMLETIIAVHKSYSDAMLKGLNRLIGALDCFSETEESSLEEDGNLGVVLENKEETMPKHKHIYLYRRSNGYYTCTVAYKTLRKTFSGKNKSEIFKKAKTYLNNSLYLIEQKSLTNFNSLAEWYLENVKRPFISTAYFTSLKQIYDKNLKSYFSKFNVADFTPVILQKFFLELCARSTRIAEDCKTLLNQIFEYAVGNNFIQTNPMKAVVVQKHYRENGKALSAEELATFKTKLDSHPVYKLPLLILLYTGARRSEFKSLQFDFESGFVRINNSKLKEHQRHKKSCLTRNVPILKALLPFEQEIKEEKWRNVNLDILHHEFADMMPGMRLNYLRHTFQTYCRLFASKEMVNLWAGHSLGRDMTDAVYNHIPPEEQLLKASLIVY